MEYLLGLGLAVMVCAFATLVGFDRDRVFYPTLVAVIATYYILFAVMGSSTRALAWESLVAAAFFALAVAGFKKSLWIVVAALAGHGVFDFFHHVFIHNPGVPEWWPGFCLSFDVLAGGFLAVLLMQRGGFASKVENAQRSMGELDVTAGPSHSVDHRYAMINSGRDDRIEKSDAVLNTALASQVSSQKSLAKLGHQRNAGYSAALLARVSTTAMFCSNSAGKPWRCCKYAGLL